MFYVQLRTLLGWTAAVATVTVAMLGTMGASPAPAYTYGEHIKPVMTKYCVACHTGDQSAGRLDLSSLEKMKRGGMSGPAIKSGKGDESSLVRRMKGLDNKQIMPPGRAPKVPAEKITLVRDWINQGAN